MELTLHIIRARFISQYDGLMSYFLSCDDETSKVLSIVARLEDLLTKPILYFLSFILPHMDCFICVFQNQLKTQLVSFIQK